MSLLSFRQAVERVRTEKGAAFAFCPIADERSPDSNRGCIGANLFVLVHCADGRAQQDREFSIHYVGGLYRSSSLVRERYRPDQVPLDAREANYRFLSRFDETMLNGDLQTIHEELQLRAEVLQAPG